MFIGHFGAGLAGKKVDSRPSLGTMFLAAQWVDLIWPLLLLLGIERVQIDPGNTVMTPLNFTYYPYTHGLLSVVIWAALFGGVYYYFKKNVRGSLLLGGLVLSHWILDFFVHRPDLPLVPWSNVKVGLGLWNNLVVSLLLELFIFGLGVYFYVRSTSSENRSGTIGMWSLLAFLLVVYLMNVFGSAPPSVNALAYVGLSQWVLVFWGYWVDRNRTTVIESPLVQPEVV